MNRRKRDLNETKAKHFARKPSPSALSRANTKTFKREKPLKVSLGFTRKDVRLCACRRTAPSPTLDSVRVGLPSVGLLRVGLHSVGRLRVGQHSVGRLRVGLQSVGQLPVGLQRRHPPSRQSCTSWSLWNRFKQLSVAWRDVQTVNNLYQFLFCFGGREGPRISLTSPSTCTHSVCQRQDTPYNNCVFGRWKYCDSGSTCMISNQNSIRNVCFSDIQFDDQNPSSLTCPNLRSPQHVLRDKGSQLFENDS